MRHLARLGLLLAVGGCVSDTITLETEDDGPQPTSDEPPTVTTTTTTTTTTPPVITTTTTGPGPTTTVTTQPPGVTTAPPDDTTESGGCFPPCAPDEVCIDGLCFGDPATTGVIDECDGMWGPGEWADCVLDDGTIDEAACMNPAAICFTYGVPPEINTCAPLCRGVCDCPAPPPTGNAEVLCADLVEPGNNRCFLDCSGGQVCPEGQTCFLDLVCVYQT